MIRNKARKLSGTLIIYSQEAQACHDPTIPSCTAERLGMGGFGGPSFAGRLGAARQGSLGGLSDPRVHTRPMTPSPDGGTEDSPAALQRSRPFLMRIPSPVPENAEALSDLTNTVARNGARIASPKGAAGPRRHAGTENAATRDIKTPSKQRPISDFLSVTPGSASRGAQMRRPSAAEQSLLRQLGLESPSASARSTGPDGRSGEPPASPGAEQRPSGLGTDTLFEGLLKAASPIHAAHFSDRMDGVAGAGQQGAGHTSMMDTLSCTGSGLTKDTVAAEGMVPRRSLVFGRPFQKLDSWSQRLV